MQDEALEAQKAQEKAQEDKRLQDEAAATQKAKEKAQEDKRLQDEALEAQKAQEKAQEEKRLDADKVSQAGFACRCSLASATQSISPGNKGRANFS